MHDRRASAGRKTNCGEPARLAAVMALVLWFVSASPTLAVPTLSVEPVTVATTIGGNIQVSVMVNVEVGPISCIALTLDYDPAVLQLVGASEGGLFSSSPDPTFFNLEKDPSNRDVVSNCVLGFGTSVSPPGELAVLQFQAIAVGVSTIGFVDAVLRDVDRVVIGGVSILSASATIGATSTPPIDLSQAARLRALPNPSGALVQLRLQVRGQPVSAAGLQAVQGIGIAGGQPSLAIFDLAGRRIRRLGWPASATSVGWDGRDALGRRVASGLYFAVMSLGDLVVRAPIVRVD